MKPTHKITIGTEVYTAAQDIQNFITYFYIKKEWFKKEHLEALNAKIEPLPGPIVFEARVIWSDSLVGTIAGVYADEGYSKISKLKGKSGRLVFTEDEE